MSPAPCAHELDTANGYYMENAVAASRVRMSRRGAAAGSSRPLRREGDAEQRPGALPASPPQYIPWTIVVIGGCGGVVVVKYVCGRREGPLGPLGMVREF